VYESGVLRKIFDPERSEVKGEWRKLHNVELIDRDCSPNIVRVIKSRRMRWAGHVARIEGGEERAVQGCDEVTCGRETRLRLGNDIKICFKEIV
jgi:hypothetical protein